MIILGYKEDDVYTMMAGINLSKHYLPPSQEDIAKSLDLAYNFLEGLLAEGRI